MAGDTALLLLADGTCLHGRPVGGSGTVSGELVFNTSMTGYQEILTDPSYAQQLVTLTTAHVGNTGCTHVDDESSRVWANGLIVRNCTQTPSNYRSESGLLAWLRKRSIVAIADIDTRYLTRHIREHGAMPAIISTETEDKKRLKQQLALFQGLEGKDLASEVSRTTVQRWHEGRGDWAKEVQPQRYHVVAFDFGIKHSILRILFDKGCHITLVPATTSVEEVLDLNPDGVFLSNGPGDPNACTYAIEAVKRIANLGLPLFGVCLGFQIMALAFGAKSYKMKFGHHGANHPVLCLDETKRVFISSQNHGFAIDESSLPTHLQPTHRSLFDNSLQGLQHKHLPMLGVQGHPEGSPGPQEMEEIFDVFIQNMEQARTQSPGHKCKMTADEA